MIDDVYSKFPLEFIQFLNENQVDPAVFMQNDLPRFVRVNPKNPGDKTQFLQELQQLNPEVQCSVEDLGWIKDFWAVSGEAKIVNTPSYIQGKIYGMDASSAMPVLALKLKSGISVLDMCCAPGAKLLYLNDLLDESSSIFGIDISQDRLKVTRSLLKKYNARNDIQLICHNAMTWDTNLQFDRILVDAECTHEGSIKHMKKFTRQWGWETFKKRVIDTHVELEQLQRGLLNKGCDLLKPGGRIVYSTCSFCRCENEDIVNFVVNNRSDMRVKIVEGEFPCRRDGNFMKFDPLISRTGGQFVAVLKKAK